MRNPTETITTINLDHDQLLVFDGGPEGRVRVLYGAAWLTEEHVRDDTVLRSGSEAGMHAGRTLIEGLGPTQVQIMGRAAGGSSRAFSPAACWTLALQGLRRLALRMQWGPSAA